MYDWEVLDKMYRIYLWFESGLLHKNGKEVCRPPWYGHTGRKTPRGLYVSGYAEKSYQNCIT